MWFEQLQLLRVDNNFLTNEFTRSKCVPFRSRLEGPIQLMPKFVFFYASEYQCHSLKHTRKSSPSHLYAVPSETVSFCKSSNPMDLYLFSSSKLFCSDFRRISSISSLEMVLARQSSTIKNNLPVCRLEDVFSAILNHGHKGFF